MFLSSAPTAHTLKRTLSTSPSATTYVLPSSRCVPRLAASACDPAASRSSASDHLAADEAAGDVGVDRRRRLEGGLPVAERPGARLLVADGEEGDQPERLLQPAHDLVERRRAVAKLGRLLVGQVGELRLELAVDPVRAVLDREERLRRQRVELRAAARPASRRASSRRRGARAAPTSVSSSVRLAGSPDFASFATRSSRRST